MTTSLTKSNKNTQIQKSPGIKEPSQKLIKCLAAQDKVGTYSIIHALTPEIAMEGTQVSVIKSELGMDKMVKLVYSMLDDLRISMGIKSDPSGETESLLIDVAIKIVTEYWFLKIEEIALFIAGCKEGKYGNSYGKLSSENIFERLSVYDQQRTGSLDNSHLDAKHSIPSDGRTSETHHVNELFSHDEKLAEFKKKMK